MSERIWAHFIRQTVRSLTEELWVAGVLIRIRLAWQVATRAGQQHILSKDSGLLVFG